jgi:hypothetical protein
MSRYRRLTISPEILFMLFAPGPHSGYTVVDHAVPADAELVNVRHGWPNVIELLIESADFEELSEGAIIPELAPLVVQSLPGIAGGQSGQA